MNKKIINGKDEGEEGKSKTYRLVFSYQGDQVKLISQQMVDMISPPSDSLEQSKNESGFWFVVRDKQNRVLYRRIIQNPIKYAVEVRSDNPPRPLAYETVEAPHGEFVLFFPVFKEAVSISLFSSPFELKEAFRPAREFAAIPLQK